MKIESVVPNSRDPENERRRRHGDVEQEDRAPVEPRQQQAAAQRAEADADCGERRPDPDRLAALLAREDVRDDRQRRGHDQCPSNTHGSADGDQLVRGVDDEHGQARAAEEHEAGLEGPLAAEAIAESAHRQ